MKVPQAKDQVTLEWLNTIFHPQGIQIQGFSFTGAANNGLDCMSTLERLSLQVIQSKSNKSSKSETLNVILKTLPENPVTKEYMIKSGYANREFQMYAKVFQDWNNFLDSRSVSLEHRFRAPICYYAAEEGEGADWKLILILEDLNSNFSTWPQGYGKSLSWNEAKPLTRQIALFHATGIGYKINQGIKSHRDEYPFLHTTIDDQNIKEYVRSGFDKTIKMLKETMWKGAQGQEELPVPPGLIDHLEIFREVNNAAMKELEPKDSEMGTICHNDLHVNNFMFSGDNNNIDAVIFDFQTVMHGKPMKDLSLFLILNCDTSLITTDLPMVLEYYHDVFHGAMNAMKTKVDYSLDKMKQDYKANTYLSISHIIAGAASWCFGKGTTSDTERRFRSALIHNYNAGMINISSFINN